MDRWEPVGVIVNCLRVKLYIPDSKALLVTTRNLNVNVTASCQKFVRLLRRSSKMPRTKMATLTSFRNRVSVYFLTRL
jgi:hypothetical protein